MYNPHSTFAPPSLHLPQAANQRTAYKQKNNPHPRLYHPSASYLCYFKNHQTPNSPCTLPKQSQRQSSCVAKWHMWYPTLYATHPINRFATITSTSCSKDRYTVLAGIRRAVALQEQSHGTLRTRRVVPKRCSYRDEEHL
ncbi:hypothetical protein MJO29_004565 [Puccinia striiformis f. sp. tritici]|nr:hypothetical protein MJO29_004565 [Puccinia striiformis f. sp. tritici]